MLHPAGSPSRRRFLLDSARAGAATVVLGACGRCAADQVKSRPDAIVYRGGYPGWPWIARAKDGSLACVFRDDGVHDFSPSGKVLYSASRDEGRTWSPARVVADEPGVDDRNAAVTPLSDGSLLVVYNTYDQRRVSRCRMVRSGDGGRAWTTPTTIADLDARTRSAAIVLSGSQWLLPIYKSPGSGAVAAVSADQGKSWQLFDVPDTAGFVGDEWSALEVEPGRVVGIVRNSGARDGRFWQTESRDAGRTWSVPRRTNLRDARSTSPAQLDFHGRTPVLTYADRRMVSVAMATTHDPEYLQWDLAGQVACYQYEADGSAIVDGSYPVSVQLDARRRLIVDYEIRAQERRIAGYVVEVPAQWK